MQPDVKYFLDVPQKKTHRNNYDYCAHFKIIPNLKQMDENPRNYVEVNDYKHEKKCENNYEITWYH